MILLFTDLDATLLDSDSYSWERARPAIDSLRAEEIPWVFVTSKTRAEVEFWRRETGNTHPYIVENGAALVVPRGYFPSLIPNSRSLDGSDIVEWGTPYLRLVKGLQRASEKARCRVRGFHDMTPAEIAAETGLPLEQAQLASKRQFDEPFVVLDPDRASRLIEAIHAEGLHCVSGSRFLHITSGAHDKGIATTVLQRAYEQAHGPVTTIGLGDNFNDLPLLENVSIPILIRSRHMEEMHRRIPRARITAAPGPEGWNSAVMDVIANRVTQAQESSPAYPAQR